MNYLLIKEDKASSFVIHGGNNDFNTSTDQFKKVKIRLDIHHR